MSALERHIAGIKAHDLIRGEDIDFKLSSSKGARNSQVGIRATSVGTRLGLLLVLFVWSCTGVC